MTHEKSKSGGSVKKNFDSSFGTSKSKRVILTPPVVLVLSYPVIVFDVIQHNLSGCKIINTRTTGGVKMTLFDFELPNELSKCFFTDPPLIDFSWVTMTRFDTKNQACASKTFGDIITYTSLYRRGHFDPCISFRWF